MRLFYQSLGASRRSTDGPYAQKLAAILSKAAAPGTEIDVRGLAPGKAIADQYRYLEFRDTGEILENGLRAEREGYDAFLIGNIFEPGLHALRELLNIPVLGLCEASVHLACLMGARFSVVNANAKFAQRVGENIAATGLADRLASMEEIEIERAGEFDRAFEDESARQAVIERFRAAARRGLDNGAECVIPAGGIVMTILADAGVHEVDLAVNMRKLTGHFTSKRLTYAPPTGALLDDVRAAYGFEIYPGAR
jgi:allantoin racemase